MCAQKPFELGFALVKAGSAHVAFAGVEQVEDHVRHWDSALERGVACAAIEPGLQALERGAPVAMERDNLAVDDDRQGREGAAQSSQLRKLREQIFVVARPDLRSLA